MTRESEYTANRDLQIAAAAPKRSAISRRAVRTFNAIDGVAPLLALCGLLFSIGLLGSAGDWLHRFWALMSLALSGVAMWAFFD